MATIARKANVSDRTVRRVITRLEADGLLIVHRDGGRVGSTNSYTVVTSDRIIHSPAESQRARPTPAALAALDMGWAPQDLASVTGANTTGVRNPYAVLDRRLSWAELPALSVRSARPRWCGECDQVTRMLDYHGDAPRPCPKCKEPRPRQPNVAERPAPWRRRRSRRTLKGDG